MAITVPTYIRYIRVVINAAPQVLFDGNNEEILAGDGTELTT